jgi:hypothetical protein
MTQKVDPRTEGGARILIKESSSSIKAIEIWRVLEKGRLIQYYHEMTLRTPII